MFGSLYFGQEYFAGELLITTTANNKTPQTIWHPTNGVGEATNTVIDTIVDELQFTLVDESGNSVTDTGTDIVTTPFTNWSLSPALPTTIWHPTNGNGEAVVLGVESLVDELGNYLVDELGYDVVDTGNDFTILADTIWSENQGI